MSLTGEVLVVDGDASIRSLLAVVVRMLPKNPVVAGDGRSAVALLGSHSYDAIVLDLVLPELSGKEVLNFLKVHAPKMFARTVVLTTLPESHWSDARGCAGVLRKPFAIEELHALLRSCCDAAIAS